MRVLFCNIAWMEKYQGIDGDIPQGGGSYVTENNNATERHNYNVYKLEGAEDLDDGDYCLGFVETMSHNGKPNQLHVEKISGCEMADKEPYVDGVTVIFCARHPHYGDTYMVGWYKNARVYRNYVDAGTAFFNILAKSEDCVLLPKAERMRNRVPRKKAGMSYGFGRANVWYATEQNEALESYLVKLEEYISNYHGKNLRRVV